MIRSATHAGSWYTETKTELGQELEGWIEGAHASEGPAITDCRAIIAPHAGYSYSGPTAAWAYKLVDTSKIKRVFILGPSHHVYLSGCAITTTEWYETPLGNLRIDKTINEELKERYKLEEMTHQVDQDEHSIELHLPYIRHVFRDRDITIVPILVGSLTPEQELEYGRMVGQYLADEANFVVVSSDFCHWGTRFSYTYYEDEEGQKSKLSSAARPAYPIHKAIEALDRRAIDAISMADPQSAHQSFTEYLRETKNTICGRHPIAVLLGSLIHLQSIGHYHHHVLKFVRYQQSSHCLTGRDSSVSYASAYLTIN